MGKRGGEGDSSSSWSIPQIRNWEKNCPRTLPELGKSLRVPAFMMVFSIPNFILGRRKHEKKRVYMWFTKKRVFLVLK